MFPIKIQRIALIVGTYLATSNIPAHAHFLWLKTPVVDSRRQAFLFFGENAADEKYHLPEALEKTEIWRRTPDGKRTRLEAKPTGENENRIGLVAALPDDGPCVLEASAVYGNYHGMLLTYGAKHVQASKLEGFNSFDASKELKLDVVPAVRGDELRLTVLWNGEPLPDVAVTVAVGDAEGVEHKSSKQGRVTVRPERDGFISVLANRRDAEAKGEHKGEQYKGEMTFVSLTFDWKKPEIFARLQEPLASFGAAVADGWLYVYGGHIGEPHDHSAANLSRHFRRLQHDGTGDWEDLPMQTPLQGVALVAHEGRLYRVGGMNARNATTEVEEDMHSTDEFARYDPATREWRALAPLPAPRSSQDAVVIGDKLYVAGGWKLAGKGRGEWQQELLAFDFAKPQVEDGPRRAGGQAWEKLPAMPSSRRAVAAGEWRGKLVVIGGIDEDGAVSRDSTIFDPATSKWTDGPQLPEGDLAGFGASAWNVDGRLYVSGLPGVLYRMSDDGQKWEEAARLKTPRFFHRLLPGPKPGTILAVAGSAEDGHVADIEVLDVR
jgi:hypothetical protein